MSDQAPEQSLSVEQRAASLFGQPEKPQQQPQQEQGDQQEAPIEGQEQQAPEFEEVEYEGERFQVPPKLKKGLMLNKDYTQKTQEHAERVKMFELREQELKLAAEQKAFTESVSQDLDQIRLIDAYLAEQVDWNSLGVEELIRKRAEREQVQERRSRLQAELSRKEGEFRNSLQGQYEELHTKTREVLAKKIPGWNAEVEKDVRDWALSQGFTAQEVSAIRNPVHAETLYKARQYDKLVAQGKTAAQQASQAAPMAKPGSVNPMPQAVKDQLNFRKALSKTAHGSAEQQRLVTQRAGALFAKR
jgi:hypothetical protein